MKKLLSILSVLTITGTAMPNVIATSFNKKDNKNNILLINNEKYKNDFFLSDKNIFNENTRNIFIDKEDNKTLYFMNFNNNYLKEIYLLSENKVVTLFVKEIENKKFTDFIKVNNKFYFCGDTGIYEFKKTENNYIKINNDDGAYQLNIDNQNNIYYLTNNLLEIKKLEVNNNKSISVVKNNEAISYFSFDKNNNLYYASKLNIFKKNSDQLYIDKSKEIINLNKIENNDIVKKITILNDENNILIHLNSGKLFFMLNKIDIDKIMTFTVNNQNNDIYYLNFFNKNFFKLSRLNTNENVINTNENVIWISVGSIILGFILIGTLLSLYIIWFKKRKKIHNINKKQKCKCENCVN